MKSLFPGKKQITLVIVTCLTIIATSQAQKKNGILPLTGIKYFNEGIEAKNIDVKIDGAQLMSNRLPLNKEIEVRLQHISGFTADANRTMFAGAEVIVLSPRGEVLLKDPNALIRNYANGFTAKDLAAFSIKFGIGADIMKGNFGGTLKIRLYDMKGKNQLRMEAPVTFGRVGEASQVSKNLRTLKTATGAVGIINGLEAKDMQVKVDTTIKVAPRMAYTSMDISDIEGSSISEMFEGKESFWVYDSDMNEVKITDILLKKVKGALESNTVNYTLKIPYRLKSNTTKLYTVRYRWENPGKSQLIDVVVTN